MLKLLLPKGNLDFIEKVNPLDHGVGITLDNLKNEQFDIIYLDPPYNTNYINSAIRKILELGIVKEESLIIVETDDEQRIESEIQKTKTKIVDKRQYGRATIIFLRKA